MHELIGELKTLRAYFYFDLNRVFRNIAYFDETENPNGKTNTEFTKAEERVDSFGLLQKYPNLIISRSLSKAYGLAGLRIGYAVSNPEIADKLENYQESLSKKVMASVDELKTDFPNSYDE